MNRSYRRLWLGQSISLVGDYIFTTTVALWIATVLLRDKPYAPAAVAASVGIVAVMTVCVAPFAGVLVDRWDKVRVALISDAVRAVIGICFAVLPWFSHSVPIWLTLTACAVGIGIQATASQFFNPARIVIVSDVVVDSQRGQAASFAQASAAIATIVGPILGAVLFVAAGPEVSFALNGLSFVWSYVAIRGVRSSHAAAEGGAARRHGFGRELTQPLRIIGGDPVLRTVIGAGTIVMLGAGTFGSLNVFFVQENLHATPQWFGVISSSLGAGILVGAVGAGFLGERAGNRLLFIGGLVACGITCLVYARLSGPMAAAVVIFGYGLAGGIVETVMAPLVLGSVSRDRLASVLSVFSSAFRLSSIVSVGVAGWLVSSMPVGQRTTMAGIGFGRIDMVFVGTAVLFLLAGLYAAVSALTQAQVTVSGAVRDCNRPGT